MLFRFTTSRLEHVKTSFNYRLLIEKKKKITNFIILAVDIITLFLNGIIKN